MNLSPNALTVLETRYLQSGETPEDLFHRVTDTVGANEPDHIKKAFYEVLSNLKFLPNSPTLFNSGLEKGSLAACFVVPVEDSMEGINAAHNAAALIFKYGGGLGYSFGRLRPKGAPISSTHGKACGPIAVLRHFNSIAGLVTQAGKRDGASMGILPVNHPDILEFIHCKDDGSLTKFNISVAATDSFMASVKHDGRYLCTDGKEMSARQVFDEICESAWRTGDPGLFFIDTVNRADPLGGGIEASNPCNESPLLPWEACNLGSINLVAHLDHDGLDEKLLQETTHLAIRFLDDVIEQSQYPLSEIIEAVRQTRKIGLGVMGWADVLASLGIPYDSEEALRLASKTMSAINAAALAASRKLAEERGAFPKANGALLRNATRTSIAPTGTISIIAGVSSGIEPIFAKDQIHYMYQDGKRIPLPQEHSGLIRTAHEVSPSWHVRMQAAFQKHTDLGVSKTINLPHDASIDDVRKAYILAWELGCKGITVYRDGCRSEQVIEAAVATSSAGHPSRRKMPDERQSITHKFHVGDQEGYLTVGLFDDGTPGELFVAVSKEGSTIKGLIDALAIQTSMALQYGVPLDAIVEKMAHTRFEPSGMTGNAKIPTATSILDYIYRWVGNRFSSIDLNERSGDACPTCGASLYHEEGCLSCKACGYSRC